MSSKCSKTNTKDCSSSERETETERAGESNLCENYILFRSREKRDNVQGIMANSNSPVFSSEQYEPTEERNRSENELKKGEAVKSVNFEENSYCTNFSKTHFIGADDINSGKTPNLKQKLLQEKQGSDLKENNLQEWEKLKGECTEINTIEKADYNEKVQEMKMEKQMEKEIGKVRDGIKENGEKGREVSNDNIAENNRSCSSERMRINKSTKETDIDKTTEQNENAYNISESHAFRSDSCDKRSKRKIIASKKNENEKPEKKIKDGIECKVVIDSEHTVISECGNTPNVESRECEITKSIYIEKEEGEREKEKEVKEKKKNEHEEREEGINETEERDEKDEQKEHTEQDVLYAEEALKEYPRLFAARLPFKATQEDLEQHFSKYGKIVDVYISKKMTSGENKGFGFVSFETQEAMERALQDKLHIICGKEIVVDIASMRDSASNRFFVLPSNHYLFRGPKKRFFFKNKTIRNAHNNYGPTSSFNSVNTLKNHSITSLQSNINKRNDTYQNITNTNELSPSQTNLCSLDHPEIKNTSDGNYLLKDKERTSHVYSNHYYKERMLYDPGPTLAYKEKIAPLGFPYHSAAKYNYSSNFAKMYEQPYHQGYMHRYNSFYMYCNNMYDAYRGGHYNVYNSNMNISGDDNYEMKTNSYSYYSSNYSNYDINQMTKTANFSKDGAPVNNVLNNSGIAYANTSSTYNTSSVANKLPGGDVWNKRGYKLFVTKLNSVTTVENLRNYFEKFGEVIDVYLPNDPYTKRPRGIAFVTFLDSECVKNILSDTTAKHIIDGKEVVIDLADPESKRKKHYGYF